MAREYFPAYHSYLEAMEELTDDERGRLFTACLLYSKTGEAPPLNGNERFVFPSFRAQIDRDKKNYSEFSVSQSEKAKKRWHAAACSGITGIAEHAKEKEKEKEKEKIPPKAPPLGDAFDRFWSEYPKKVGKIAAKKAFERAIRKTTLDTLLTAIRRQKCGSQWSKDNGQYIPNPATWLNQGRWEDEVEPIASAHEQQPYSPRAYHLERDDDGQEVVVYDD